MKFLKYILGIIGVALVVFLAIGFIKPTLSYDCEVLVEKPISEAWSVTQDEAKMSEWLDGFQKFEHVSGTPGTVGAVSVVYFDNDGEQMSIRETITEIVPDESISMTFVDDFMNMEYKMSMTEIDGLTKISSNTVAEGNGMFSKSIMALIGGMIKGQEEANLANLKKAIEENTKIYSQPAEEVIVIE